jgi:Tfp pilus assembly protein PilO
MNWIYGKYSKTVGMVWAGCLVLFILVYLLVVGPQRKLRQQVEKELAEKKQMYHMVIKAAQAETRTQLNEQIVRLRNRLKDFVSDSEYAANLTFDISEIATAKQVDSFRIKSKDRHAVTVLPDCEYLCENRLTVSFAAAFNQFATFLNALERYQPVVFVDKFKIMRSEQDSSAHKVNMDLAVYIKKRQES